MHSKQASSIQVPQYCRIGQFMTGSGIFFPGSSPSRGTVHAWIEDRCLPVKRIGKTNYIDMKALSQRLARQALGNGFRYVMEETELVKLSLSLKGPICSKVRPAPVAEPSTTGKKRHSLHPVSGKQSVCRPSGDEGAITKTAFILSLTLLPLNTLDIRHQF